MASIIFKVTKNLIVLMQNLHHFFQKKKTLTVERSNVEVTHHLDRKEITQRKNISSLVHNFSMSRLLVSFFFLLVPTSLAFAPTAKVERPTTVIEAVSRRNVLATAAGGIGVLVGSVMVPEPSLAFSQQLEDYQIEPSQLGTEGKFDLNAAGVVSNCV